MQCSGPGIGRKHWPGIFDKKQWTETVDERRWSEATTLFRASLVPVVSTRHHRGRAASVRWRRSTAHTHASTHKRLNSQRIR